MNVLMVGNIASVGWNLAKGLFDVGIHVTLVGNKKEYISGTYDYTLSWKDFLRKNYGKTKFDVIHIHSPNFKKLGAVQRYLKNAKLICHWHGGDLRIPKKGFPVYNYIKKRGDYHLYSTVDLGWWLRKIPEKQKEQFICPVDTEQFKSYGEKTDDIIFMGSGKDNFHNYKIKHDDMPKFISQYKNISISGRNIDESIICVAGIEAASCGVVVKEYSWMNRNWVIQHASIQSQTPKLIEIYQHLLGE